jgi:hypothetical protein
VREKKVKLGCACECLNGLHQHVVVRGLIWAEIEEEEDAKRVSRVIFMKALL